MSSEKKVFDAEWCLEVTTRLTKVETKLHMLYKVWYFETVTIALGFLGVIAAILSS